MHQPARPRRDVGRQRDAHQRDERRRPVEDDRAEQGPALAERPPRAGAPQPGEQAEDGQRVDRGPLRAARQAEADPAEDAARGATTSRVAPRGQPVAQPLAVGHHAVHAAEGEERQEDVEQREPRQHELETVDGEQQASDEAEDRRAGDPPGEAAHQQDHQRAHHRRCRPPAGGVHPEDLDPGGDQPLADLGVDDHRRTVLEQPGQVAVEDRLVGVLDVAAHVAVVEQRPRVLGVVGLVEGERVRRAEVPAAQEERQAGQAEGAGPPEHRDPPTANADDSAPAAVGVRRGTLARRHRGRRHREPLR